MSTSSIDGPIGVDLGDDDAIAVAIEHVGQTDQHHVVVVDEGHRDRSGGGADGGHAADVNYP